MSGLGEFDELDAEIDATPEKDVCPFAENTTGKPKWAHCCIDGKAAGKRCGAHWPNHESYCHCSLCHLTFGSDAAFDKHRTGGTCTGTKELLAAGWSAMPAEDGTATIWRTPAPIDSPWSKP